MRALTRLLVLISLLFAPLPLTAQAPPVHGSWEGNIQAGDMAIPFQVDVEKPAAGKKMTGTFSGGPNNVKGLPFDSVTQEGRAVRLVLKNGTAETVFEATLAADGKSMAGTVTHEGVGYPFQLTRTSLGR